MKVIAVIPARYASTRLPGKPLLDIAGKPMIQHVYERVAASSVDSVIVATDDRRIYDVVTAFGGKAAMTSPEHQSGTDRVAEAAKESGADVVVNVQGDEPLMDPALIDDVVKPLREDSSILMGTLAHVITHPEEVASPDAVKVVVDKAGFALYFSRSPIPHVRDAFGEGVPQEGGPWMDGILRHIGIYVFRADFLQEYASMAPTFLERHEKLEQLRALENGHRIRVVETARPVVGVDTPEDLERVRGILENQS